MKQRAIKKCRGNGKSKGFGCGNTKEIFRYGLCRDCYKVWLFDTPEGQDILKKSTIQGKKKAEKQVKQEFKKRKDESKSIAQLIQEARRPFQKLIRIRDHGQDCICCGRPLPFNIGEYDAGHYLKAELYTGLIFHPDNVHGQLTYCNKHSHGNETGYADGIIKRIGKEGTNKLHSIKAQYKSYKWTREELNKLKKYYNRELKLVEKGEKNIQDVDLTVGILSLK